LLNVPSEFQQAFEPTHESMRKLELRRDLPAHQLAANLRRAFSGIVAGNVKEHGIRMIDQYGPFELHGDRELLSLLDELLTGFIAQKRMKLSGEYRPCYRIV
jgi:hypothetical protein